MPPEVSRWSPGASAFLDTRDNYENVSAQKFVLSLTVLSERVAPLCSDFTLSLSNAIFECQGKLKRSLLIEKERIFINAEQKCHR
jgi:hypothetical protein